MKFSILLSLSAVFSIALSAPSPRLQNRLARRSASGGALRQSSPSTHIPTTSTHSNSNTSSKIRTKPSTKKNNTIQYSSNWAGAVLTTPPSGETYNYVSGTFTVPTPSIPSSVSSIGDGEWSSSAWVGIDGDTCTTAILQTGVDFTISQNGDVSYDAWYEWYPDYAYDFAITINAGDVITTYVQADTLTSGSAVVENLTTGETASIELTSTSSLCGENAEWIVEDFEENGSLVPLANFGTVTFSGAVAKTAESEVGVADAVVFAIDSNSVVLTETTLESGDEITVSYI